MRTSNNTGHLVEFLALDRTILRLSVACVCALSPVIFPHDNANDDDDD